MKKITITLVALMAILTGCTPVKETKMINDTLDEKEAYYDEILSKAIEEAKTPSKKHQTFDWTEPKDEMDQLYTVYGYDVDYVVRCKSMYCWQHFNNGDLCRMKYIVSVEKNGTYDIYWFEE